jgi:hypothetical protein
MWLRPGVTGELEPAFGRGGSRLIRAFGLLALLVYYLVVYAIGVSAWS